MAEIIKWTDDQQKEWDEWLESRPQVVKDLALKLPPTKLYRLGSTGHRVTIYSYSESGTVTVNITGQYNRILFSRQVFGINPDDLEECELPLLGEELGDISKEAGYSQEDVMNILIPMVTKEMGK